MFLQFDGVYMDSDVWLNGQHLGNHPYGYTSFQYDLTPYVKFGATDNENVLAVRVNVKQPCSRWYSGAGIYRHVWLTLAAPVHIATLGNVRHHARSFRPTGDGSRPHAGAQRRATDAAKVELVDNDFRSAITKMLRKTGRRMTSRRRGGV